MPSKTPKQRRFMAAAANNPDFARRAGIPQSVAKEYHAADKKAEGGLAAMRKGGKAFRRERREQEGYEKKATRRGGSGTTGAYSFGLAAGAGSRKRKGWLATNPQVKAGSERRKRRWAQRRQERGKWGDEVRTNVKSPQRRRNLVRAGWIPVRDPNRKVPKTGKGRESKKYKYGLDKNTVFYPPTEVTPFTTGQPTGGLARTIHYRDPRSYIAGGAEGGRARGISMRGDRAGLGELETNEMRFQEGGQVPEWQRRLGTEPLTLKQIRKKLGTKGAYSTAAALAFMRKHGWKPAEEGEVDLKKAVFYPPTAFGPTGVFTGNQPPRTTYTGYDPYYGRGPGTTPPRAGGRRGRGPGRRGGRGRRGRNGEEEPPIRDIPGARPPGPVTPPAGEQPPPTPYVPPDRRAGRDTELSRQLAAHREVIRAQLALPPAGFAGGGAVKGYQEGGTARADNPYDPVKQKYQWRAWERRQGRDPDAPETPAEAPPVAEAEPAEPPSIWDRIRGYGSERDAGRIDEQLEEMEQARGGSVGYQEGGEVESLMAELRGRMSTPTGGVPPRMMQRGGLAALMRRVAQQQGGGGGRSRGLRGIMERLRRGQPLPGGMRRTGGSRRVIGPGGQELWRGAPGDPLPPQFGGDPRRGIRGGPGGVPFRPPPGPPRPMPGVPGGGAMIPAKSRPLTVPPNKRPPTGGPLRMPPMAGEYPGGAGVPPNLRGMLQARRMMNRPPPMVGRGVNRVGQGDQQGALARAMQRGAGRAPMGGRRSFRP